jgi:hypothetical protein
MVGEDLVYNVRYSFINLGQVRIRILKKLSGPAHTAYQAKAFIDSYSGVPFVDLHAVYESVFDSTIYSMEFTGRSVDGNLHKYTRYRFEYDSNRVILETGIQDTIPEKVDTAALDGWYQDGLSLFFYARGQLFSATRMNIPTLINEERANTYIDFASRRTSVEIDAVEYPIDVVPFDGVADFVGIFGLTGDFEGWFSNDVARVPIMAKMKVIVGNITIELMSWTREGWNPPKAN